MSNYDNFIDYTIDSIDKDFRDYIAGAQYNEDAGEYVYLQEQDTQQIYANIDNGLTQGFMLELVSALNKSTKNVTTLINKNADAFADINLVAQYLATKASVDNFVSRNVNPGQWSNYGLLKEMFVEKTQQLATLKAKIAPLATKYQFSLNGSQDAIFSKMAQHSVLVKQIIDYAVDDMGNKITRVFGFKQATDLIYKAVDEKVSAYSESEMKEYIEDWFVTASSFVKAPPSPSVLTLGKTHFSQVHIYDIETEEQLSDTSYYFINIAEKREFLNVENTHKGISTNEYNPNSGVYHLSSPVDDAISLVSQAGLADVDLWHDPMLFGSLFLSNQLVTALLKADISKDALALVQCQLR